MCDPKSESYHILIPPPRSFCYLRLKRMEFFKKWFPWKPLAGAVSFKLLFILFLFAFFTCLRLSSSPLWIDKNSSIVLTPTHTRRIHLMKFQCENTARAFEMRKKLPLANLDFSDTKAAHTTIKCLYWFSPKLWNN